MSQPVYVAGADSLFGSGPSYRADNSDVKVSILVPTVGTERGDIILAFVMNHAPLSIGTTITPPDATWTEILQAEADSSVSTQKHTIGIFWRRVVDDYINEGDAGVGINYTFTRPNSDGQLWGSYTLWRGAMPFDVLGGIPVVSIPSWTWNEAAANVTLPAFQPANVDSTMIYMASYADRFMLSEFVNYGTPSPNTNPVSTVLVAAHTFLGVMAGGQNDGNQAASRAWPANASVNAANIGLVFALFGPPGVPENDQRIIVRDGMNSYATRGIL